MSVTIGTLRQVGVVQSQPLNFLAFGFVILTAAIIIALQIMTFRRLHHHNNTVAERMAEGNHPNPPITSTGAAIERQLTRATIYVAGLLALVFVPTAFDIVITAITNKPYIKLINPVLVPLFTSCSGINPILYYRGNPKVKQE